jgi:hypothetical protein
MVPHPMTCPPLDRLSRNRRVSIHEKRSIELGTEPTHRRRLQRPCSQLGLVIVGSVYREHDATRIFTGIRRQRALTSVHRNRAHVN